MSSLSLDFLAGLAHELRTPLGAIGGYAELLEVGVHGPVTPAQADGLRRIRKNQQLMVSLITAFMAYAEVAEGQVELQPEHVPLTPALRRAIEDVERRAHEKSIDIVVDSDGSESGLVAIADPDGLDTILTELLVDAVESTPGNGEVRIGAARSGDTVRVEVTSTGDPISPAAVDRAFIPFDREGKGNRVSAAPHALSLPHARALARAMGGDVRVIPGSFLRALALQLPSTA